MSRKAKKSQESEASEPRVVVNLLAHLVANGKTLRDGAPLLRRLGVETHEIAAVFGTQSNAVRAAIAQSNKKKPVSKVTEA